MEYSSSAGTWVTSKITAVCTVATPAPTPAPTFNGNTKTWVGTGVLTAVRDQGTCGNCYAHVSTEVVESFAAIYGGVALGNLSVQQMTSCSTSLGNAGCGGGSASSSFEYARTVGLTAQANFPYADGAKTTASACKYSSSVLPPSPTKIKGYKRVMPGEANLKRVVGYGPAWVSIDATDMQLLTGGEVTCAGTSNPSLLDHAVQVVGYDATYWYFRNSWGTNWANAGFFKIKRKGDSEMVGTCGIALDVNYPTFDNFAGAESDPDVFDQQPVVGRADVRRKGILSAIVLGSVIGGISLIVIVCCCIKRSKKDNSSKPSNIAKSPDIASGMSIPAGHDSFSLEAELDSKAAGTDALVHA